MPQQHLLDDETGLDGLADADVVGDEQIDASHVDGAHQWVELEVLDADATAKRRLQKTSVRVGGGTPAHCIEKRFEGVGVILAGDRRQPRTFDDLCSGLNFPYDLDLFTQAILIDG